MCTQASCGMPGRLASPRYGIDVRTLLIEAGLCRLAGARENMLTDIALALAGGAAGNR